MADCPHCGSPFSGSHFGDCPVSENLPRRMTQEERDAMQRALDKSVTPVDGGSEHGV
jgi:hypothetical protein